jgi:hypothetical protein
MDPWRMVGSQGTPPLVLIEMPSEGLYDKLGQKDLKLRLP